MPKHSFTAQRQFDDERFTPVPVHSDDHQKTILAFFEPGQFVPVHAPDSSLTVYVRDGAGTVVDGDDVHDVSLHDVVTVPAGEDRGIRAAEEGRLEVLLVASPPPDADDHEPVRRGLEAGVFRPERAAPTES